MVGCPWPGPPWLCPLSTQGRGAARSPRAARGLGVEPRAGSDALKVAQAGRRPAPPCWEAQGGGQPACPASVLPLPELASPRRSQVCALRAPAWVGRNLGWATAESPLCSGLLVPGTLVQKR